MESLPGPGVPKTEEQPFSKRVEKTFGSLFASLQPQPSPSPYSLSSKYTQPQPNLWSLSGEEAEKREWRRDKDTSARDANPCSSSFQSFLSPRSPRRRKNKSLDDQDNEERENGEDDDDDDDDDDEEEEGLNDWDVRSSIGLDSTLDNEEEEDTYDKVAVGRENAGDRLYMRDITDKNDSSGSLDDLPNTSGKKQRDPRANRWAARIRLKEDDVEAGMQAEPQKGGQAPASMAEKDSSVSAKESDKVKPILKRKEHESTSKQSKRVRFDPGCVSGDGPDGAVTVKESSNDMVSAEAKEHDDGSALSEKVSRVPDYVRNPSKYKCYSLDSTGDMNDKSNTGAFLNFVESAKRSENAESGSEQANAPRDLPKSIAFVPRKKSDTARPDIHLESTHDKESRMKQSLQPTSCVGVATGEDEEIETGDMEIDQPEPSAGPDGANTFRKHGRQYRSKSRADSPS